MKNKKRIEKKLDGTEFTLGGFNDSMELLNEPNIKKVVDVVGYGTTYVDVHIARKPFVVDVTYVGTEIGISIISKSGYIDRHGDKRWRN